MPFAHSVEDEAERWLRAMRLHGRVGAALQALGVGETALMTASEAEEASEASGLPPHGAEALDQVTRRAGELVPQGETVGTADLLFAVMDVYGKPFDSVLYRRGTSREGAGRAAGVHDARPAGLTSSATAGLGGLLYVVSGRSRARAACSTRRLKLRK